MIGTNERGEFVELKDYDPLTGTRSISEINKASHQENIVLSSEHALAQAEEKRAYEEGLKKTQKEVRAAQRAKVIANKEATLKKYNQKVLLYQQAELMNQKLNIRNDELSYEKALLDFQRQPMDRSIAEDGGFKPRMRGYGRAHISPITDFEKVIQGTEESLLPVVIDYNPLASNQSKEVYMSREEYAEQMAQYQSQTGDGLREVTEKDVVMPSESMGFGSPGMGDFWSDLLDTTKSEAQNRLETEVKNLINPPKSTSTSAPTVITQPSSPQYIPMMTGGGIDQKYILIGAGALGLIAVLALVMRRK